MKFEVLVLGCGSATPTLKHNPTSQLINHDEHYFLFDCGEGTQLQLRRYKVKFQRIKHIFITHLHGDHYLGLPGLISTMHLLGRTTDLHIYSHKDLKEATEVQLRISHSRLRFKVVWHPLKYEGMETIFENKKLIFQSFPLHHGVETCGFRISEKEKLRNIKQECIEKYNISIPRIRQIKEGADYKLSDGSIIPNEELTTAPNPPKSYAFCTDTAYAETTAKYVSGVDLLYHEATFRKKEAERARATLHSTTLDAALVAKEANAGKLLLGHYSARYKKDNPFLQEASSIFKNVMLADEGLRIPV